MQHDIAALVGSGLAGLSGIKMVLAGGSGDEFAGSGLFNSLGCSLMGFYFGHKKIVKSYKAYKVIKRKFLDFITWNF